jgi:hypothetical protein
MPRLAVIDAAAVDGRRRLVLVRRDNVEHLLMIGGPTDIDVEPNIVRAMPGRDQLPQRPGTAEPPRLAPMPEPAGWADEGARPESLDLPEPAMPEPPPRPARPSFVDEVRRPAPALAERRNEPLSGFAPEPMALRPEREPRPEPMAARLGRSEPLMPRPPRHSEPPKAPPVRAERAAAPPPPPPVPPAAPPPVSASSAEQNLAEMAQRLEAALRRPGGENVAPPVAPEPPAAPARPSRNEAPPAPAKGGPEKGGFEKSSFENLEDEMASLLGRQKPPS